MSDELLIAISGVVLSVLTYFAGVYRTKHDQRAQRQHEREEAERNRAHALVLEQLRAREAAIARVVATYLDLVQRNYASGIHGFVESAPEQLPDDSAVREAIRRVEENFGRPIWGEFGDVSEEVDLKAFFLFMRKHRLTFFMASPQKVIDRMRSEGEYRPRPT